MEAMEFVAITMSRPGRDLKTGIAFSSSFTMGWLSGRLARAEAISSASSMKHTKRSTCTRSSSAARNVAAARGAMAEE